MPFSAGARLGPYEIVGLLGGGGMGEVYRALDTRLQRDVTIKTLPDAFTADADRLARPQERVVTVVKFTTGTLRRFKPQ